VQQATVPRSPAPPPAVRAGAPGGRPVRRPGTDRPATAAGLGLGLASSVAAGWGHPAWWALLVLPLVVAGGDLAAVAVLPGRQRWAGAATEAAAAAALTLSPGGWIPPAALAGLVIARVARRGPRPRLTGSAARLLAAAGAAAAVAVGLRRLGLPGVSAAAVGMGVWWAVAHTLAATAAARRTGRRLTRLLASRAPESFASTAVAAASGATTAWIAAHAPAGLLGLLAPVALLVSSARHGARSATEASLFAELARGQEQAGLRTLDEGAQAVVTAAARLLGGADVELVLLGAEGAVRYAGAEQGAPVRARVDPAAFDDPWLLRALGSRGARGGSDGARPVLATAVGTAGSPVAVLLARRPAGAAPFARRDVLLADVLAAQAASWLSLAGLRPDPGRPAAGVAGATATFLPGAEQDSEADAARAVLRESAVRLARLAAADGAVADIVDELQVVERSVASLLGALALSARPSDPGRPLPAAAEPSVPTPDVAWTTTGTLA